jgi:hypothetical protein
MWKPRKTLWIKKKLSTDARHECDCAGDDGSERGGDEGDDDVPAMTTMATR